MTDFFRHYVWHNLGLKIVSVALATALWLVVAHDPVAEIAIQVPIEFRNVPENLEINAEYIPQAQLRLRGPERLVRRLQAADVHPEIDLAGAKPGERTFDLTAQQIRLQRHLTVVQVVPGQVHMSFDTRLTREVEIHPRVTGNFADGQQIVKVDADPPRITITGPRHHVEKIDAATTDPIDATGTRGSAVFNTNVYVADPLVQVVQTTSIRVTVLVQKVGSSTTH